MNLDETQRPWFIDFRDDSKLIDIEFYEGAPVSFFSLRCNVNAISDPKRERLHSIICTIDAVWNIIRTEHDTRYVLHKSRTT